MRRYGRIPFGLTLGPNDTDGKKTEQGQVLTERPPRNQRNRADSPVGSGVFAQLWFGVEPPSADARDRGRLQGR